MTVIPAPLLHVFDIVRHVPTSTLSLAVGILLLTAIISIYLGIFIVAPTPRPPRPSEKQYITVSQDGSTSTPQAMPSWLDEHESLKELALDSQITPKEAYQISPGELYITVVVPAYNEEHRLNGMLEDAVEYLARAYPHTPQLPSPMKSRHADKDIPAVPVVHPRGWEILIISDGSTDKTVDTALAFARTHVSASKPPTPTGPWSRSRQGLHSRSDSELRRLKVPIDVPPGSIRIVKLEENRGKGGAVTHGMRHARGQYVAFADADGASRISDIGRLIAGCERTQDHKGRAVGIGSRAHLADGEEAVKRSVLRKFLMRAFHLFLKTMTPPATAAIRDTQCGFKIFTRAALPYIVPFMHSEGWIFDVEMLMLAESARIPMVEVAIGWKEVKGSKLNVLWDSLGMAWGLAILRAAWIVGVYKRDV